eukprot:Pgem_evm1s19054
MAPSRQMVLVLVLRDGEFRHGVRGKEDGEFQPQIELKPVTDSDETGSSGKTGENSRSGELKPVAGSGETGGL